MKYCGQIGRHLYPNAPTDRERRLGRSICGEPPLAFVHGESPTPAIWISLVGN